MYVHVSIRGVSLCLSNVSPFSPMSLYFHNVSLFSPISPMSLYFHNVSPAGRAISGPRGGLAPGEAAPRSAPAYMGT